MLAITLALFALLTPYVAVFGVLKASTLEDTYIVDLGYQLNRGQAVVVMQDSRHKPWAPVIADLRLMRVVPTTSRTTLSSPSETFALPLRHLAPYAFFHLPYPKPTALPSKMRVIISALKHIPSGLVPVL